MRGQKEKACLDVIVNSIFYKGDGTLIKDLDGKTYLDVTEAQFLSDYLSYTNLNSKNIYGLTEDDRKQFLNIFRTIHENPQLSSFPDFIFNNGFIEHFQITSSKETRKGAVEIKEQEMFRKKVNSELEEIKNEWNRTPSYDNVRTKRWIRENAEHTYDFLLDSFKTNWQNHIDSMDKYSGSKEVGIFLIENCEFALSMFENICPNWYNEMSRGDLREPQKFNYFRLSRDKNLLNYVYQFKEKINYVIYVYEKPEELPERQKSIFIEHSMKKDYEIIKVENIPYLLKLLPWDFFICPMCVKNVTSVYNISQKFIANQEEDTNE